MKAKPPSLRWARMFRIILPRFGASGTQLSTMEHTTASYSFPTAHSQPRKSDCSIRGFRLLRSSALTSSDLQSSSCVLMAPTSSTRGLGWPAVTGVLRRSVVQKGSEEVTRSHELGGRAAET